MGREEGGQKKNSKSLHTSRPPAFSLLGRGVCVFSGGEEGEMGSRKCPEPPTGSRGLAHLVSQATS